MALLSGFNELDSNTATFSDWLQKTNELIRYMRGDTISGKTSIMSANSLPGGSMTFGNATLFGQFTSNTMVVINDGVDDGDEDSNFANSTFGGLRGGRWIDASNTIVSDTLYVVSNTTFTAESTEVYVNSTYGLIVENTTELRYDVLYIGDGPAGSNTNAQLHWQSSNNQLNFNDDVRATFGGASGTEVFGGTGQYEMFYSAADNRMYTNTDIQDIRSTANLNLITDVYELRSESNNELMMTANVADGVELYWDGNLRMGTNTHGIVVYGDTIVQDNVVVFDNNKILMGGAYPYNGAEDIATYNFQIYTDGTDGIIVSGDKDLNIFVHEGFNLTNEPGTVNFITANNDGSSEVVLYNNGDARLETTGSQVGEVPGVEIFGEANTTTLRVRTDANFDGFGGLNSNNVHWDASANTWNYRDATKITLGDSDDWEMFYTAAGRAYSNTDNMDIRARVDMNMITDIFELKSETGSELYLTANVNNGVELYWDNIKKVSTNTYGVEVYGQVIADNGFVTYNNQPIEMGGTVYGNTHNFEIVTDGTNSFITETTNDLFVRAGDNLRITDNTGTTALIVANTSGEVTLYHNNIEKLQTNTTGIEVYGEANTETLRVQDNAYFDGSAGLDSNEMVWNSSNNALQFTDDTKAIFGNDEDLSIYHDGTQSNIRDDGFGPLVISGTNLRLEATDGTRYISAVDNQDVRYYSPAANTVELTINDAGLQIENDANTNTLRVRSTALLEDDVFFDGTANDALHWDASLDTLNWNDNVKATFGDDSDLEIYHDGTHSRIADVGTGELRLQYSQLRMWDTSGVTNLVAVSGGETSLYHNGSEKLATTSTGIDVIGTVVADGVTVGNSEIIQLGTTMQLYNDGSISYINETGTGSLVLQSNNLVLESTAGESYLFAQADSALTLYYNGNAKLATATDGIDITGTLDVSTDLTVEGTTNLNGNINLGSDNADNIIFNGYVDSAIIPDDNNTYDLGTASLQWQDIWLSGTASIQTLDVNGSATILDLTVENNLNVSNNVIVTNDVTATDFIGSGDQITDLNASNINAGTIGDAFLPGEISSNVSGTSAQSNTIQMHTSTTGAEFPVVFAAATSGYQDATGDSTFTFNPFNDTLTVDNLVVDTAVTLPSGINFVGTTFFEDIEVANNATILNLEVTSLEANGVAFTGTGGDVDSTSATVIDSFPVGQTQGYKYFVHGEDLGDANSGYAVEINVIVTDNNDIYYTRYGEVENNMADVTIVPILASNTTHIDLQATCLSASVPNTHRFKVLKIETRP